MSAKRLGFAARYSCIMEAMKEAWTDRRLDGLNHKVEELERRMDLRFDQVDGRFNQLEKRVDDRFDHFDSRFNRLEQDFQSFQHSALQLSGVVIAALIGFIATAQIF